MRQHNKGFVHRNVVAKSLDGAYKTKKLIGLTPSIRMTQSLRP